jgi:hypothetical protein
MAGKSVFPPSILSCILQMGLFGIVVAVAVQSVFRLEMHQNNVFFLKKIIFEINISKRSKNIKNNNF